jgi:hypothetical protein
MLPYGAAVFVALCGCWRCWQCWHADAAAPQARQPSCAAALWDSSLAVVGCGLQYSTVSGQWGYELIIGMHHGLMVHTALVRGRWLDLLPAFVSASGNESSCPVPRRLVYVRHVRILDSKKIMPCSKVPAQLLTGSQLKSLSSPRHQPRVF